MVLTGLEGNQVYLITVKGFNNIGQGPASAPVTAKTRMSRECSSETSLVMMYTKCTLLVMFA